MNNPVILTPVTDAERLAAEQPPEAVADDLGLPIDADIAALVKTIDGAMTIIGDLCVSAPLLIEGVVEGRVLALEHGVAVARHAHVHADIAADAVTVRGAVTGNVSAAKWIRIASGGRVEGDLAAPQVVIEEGSWFRGRVDSKRTEAALSVARHRLNEARKQASRTA